jgi:hypothetical protein
MTEIKSQAEWDALDKTKEQEVVIKFGEIMVNKTGKIILHAWDNATVHAGDNATVHAWDNATVHAWDNATVRAGGNCIVIRTGKQKITKKGNAQIVNQSQKQTDRKLADWLELFNPPKQGKKIILFKRVSDVFKTQEKTPNETFWEIGKTLEHPTWEPKTQECGPGKYHGCATAFDCDLFRSLAHDKYIAVAVDKKDIYVWPKNAGYPMKVGFRKCMVLHECNRRGEKI